MQPIEAWKNFNLGQELSISGTFIYNGLRQFHEMRILDNSDDVFEVLYNLSVGIERLLKVAVVLLEHNDNTDINQLEQSLITHNHLELLNRIKKHVQIDLGSQHTEFLSLLTNFYKSLRYDGFMMQSVYDFDKEKKALLGFLVKHLNVELEDPTSIFAISNDPRYNSFIRKLVIKFSSKLYEVIREKSYQLNIYTYELRYGSKAETVFLGKADLPTEDIVWKEILLFFMNTKSSNGMLEFLRNIEPLDFDPALTQEYLECFQSNTAKSYVIDELEFLYDELEKPGERLEMMKVIGDRSVHFDMPDSDEDFTE
jgi:hypothetical protein